jgi:hypothetical protein
MKRFLPAAMALALAAPTAAAQAQIALSANDNKLVLDNGATRTARDPAPDTLSIIDLSASPPRLKGEIQVPASVVGPPSSVAIAPNERFALVTANQRHDPADPSKLVPGNSMAWWTCPPTRRASPPRSTRAAARGRVHQPRRHHGAGGEPRRGHGERLPHPGRDHVQPAGKVEIGPVSSEVSHVAFTPDGRHALVTRYGDHMVNVLTIDNDKVTKLTARSPRRPPLRPVHHARRPLGGGGQHRPRHRRRRHGEPDRPRPRARGASWTRSASAKRRRASRPAPTGRFAAVTVMNGSNKPPGSPFHGPGLVRMLRIADGRLSVVSEARVGTWSQGAAFSPDGRTLLVGNMVEREVQVLRVSEEGRLTDTGTRLGVSGGRRRCGRWRSTAGGRRRAPVIRGPAAPH